MVPRADTLPLHRGITGFLALWLALLPLAQVSHQLLANHDHRVRLSDGLVEDVPRTSPVGEPADGTDGVHAAQGLPCSIDWLLSAAALSAPVVAEESVLGESDAVACPGSRLLKASAVAPLRTLAVAPKTSPPSC